MPGGEPEKDLVPEEEGFAKKAKSVPKRVGRIKWKR